MDRMLKEAAIAMHFWAALTTTSSSIRLRHFHNLKVVLQKGLSFWDSPLRFIGLSGVWRDLLDLRRAAR